MPSLSRSVKLAAAAFLLAAGAKSWAVMMEDVVAEVNGKPLMLSEYRKNLRTVLENYQHNMPAVLKEDDAVKEIRRKVLDQMVDDEVLAQEADKLKFKIYARELDKGIEEVQERNFRVDEETGKRRSDAEMSAVLASELKKEGLSEDQFRDRIRRQLLIRKVVEDQVRSKLKEPDDKRASETFDKLKFIVAQGTSAVKGMGNDEAQAYAAFAVHLRDSNAERVRVSHILVKVPPGAALVDKNKALERAQALKKRLDNGEDFYELAKKESDDAESAARGGDLGFILRGWMPPEFEKVAFSIDVGQVSDPVETTFGYHLIRVEEKKAKESLNYDQLKPDIKQFLYNLDFQKELQTLVKRLRAQATIEEKLPTE